MGSTSKQVVAFIPVRGGSKSIPLKNMAPLAGRPLIYWTAAACSECPAIRETFVATDHDAIRARVESLELPRVSSVARGAETATDTAATELALLEFARSHDFEHIVLVQATSPLLTADDLTGGIHHYLESGADSLLSVVRTKRFIWRTDGPWAHPVNYDPQRRPRRQDWSGQLVENGAYYITSRSALLASGCRLSGRIATYEMAEESYYELDEASDWRIVEQLMADRRRASSDLRDAAKRIRLFIADVDGTLTDGGMYYTEAGEVMKRFDTRDAFGMNLLRRHGIEPALLTAENSPIVLARARKLNIARVYTGIQDKEAHLEAVLSEMGIGWDQLAYVGDDLNDLGVIRRAGFSACPADAAAEVAEIATYVCKRPGGHGAVREACEVILARLDATAISS